MPKRIKIAYIGGGSKMWARIFMNDLALAEGIFGEIDLYDIDLEAAFINQKIGKRANENPACKTKWDYVVQKKIENALIGADFVIISILPGTFEEMNSDVHAPEEFGIFQSVGDTTGPGGVLRAMRTVPIFEEFARKIKEYCPEAWVINFTNPMSICTKTLYDVFPEIKAFGCCHEVFNATEFLCCVVAEVLNIPRPNRQEIEIDVSGINHFTWITKAKYKDIDVFDLLPKFIDRFYEKGYSEYENPEEWKTNFFSCGNKIKENLFLRYGVLGGAGDRHLAEFMNNRWYLENPDMVHSWQFSLTPVSFRIEKMKLLIAESVLYANGEKPIVFIDSKEEGVDLMKALLGLENRRSNVNFPNQGQMPDFPRGAIVETNCIFSEEGIRPLAAGHLPGPVKNLVMRNCQNVEELYRGIKERDLDIIFGVFLDQPLCSNLTLNEGRILFNKMVINTRKYLDPFFNLSKWEKL